MTEETYRFKKLVAAIITQAVEDYRAMVAKGWIANGKNLLPIEYIHEKKRARMRGIHTRREAASEVIHFFKPGGMLERWIDVAQLEVTACQIRRKIGITANQERNKTKTL